MQINKKVGGFTLSEVIIVLVLTSIVVGLAFSVLSLVQKEILGLKENYQKKLELNKLEALLWLDFNRYSEINYDINQNKLVFKNELDSIYYIFKERYIVKENDTFFISIKDKSFFYDGENLIQGQVDAIDILTKKSFQDKQIFVFKNNDATLYINSWDSN